MRHLLLRLPLPDKQGEVGRFHVGQIEWTVELDDELTASSGEPAWGSTSFKHRKISLDPKAPTNLLTATYGHELTHVFLSRLGLTGDDPARLDIRTVGQLCEAWGEFFMDLVLGNGADDG